MLNLREIIKIIYKIIIGLYTTKAGIAFLKRMLADIKKSVKIGGKYV